MSYQIVIQIRYFRINTFSQLTVKTEVISWGFETEDNENNYKGQFFSSFSGFIDAVFAGGSKVQWRQVNKSYIFEKNFNCQISFEIQWDPTPNLLEIVAIVLYFTQMIKSQPTHDDISSLEGEEDWKIELPL